MEVGKEAVKRIRHAGEQYHEKTESRLYVESRRNRCHEDQTDEVQLPACDKGSFKTRQQMLLCEGVIGSA